MRRPSADGFVRTAAVVMGWVRAALLWGLLAGAAARGEEELSRHLHRVHLFSCQLPQPRAVAAEALFCPGTDERVLPAVTVLHRCEAAGCCGPGLVCAPDSSSNVTLWFNVTSSVNGGWRLLAVSAINETHCACQLHANLR